MRSYTDPFTRAMRAPSAAVGGALLMLTVACGDDGTGPVVEPPPAVYDLVVEARVRGFRELYRVPLDGGAPVQLLAGEVNAAHPAPSPGGLHVAYWSMVDDEIWVQNIASGERRNVSQYDDEIDVAPTWSPDGTRLAFVSLRSGGGDIYVVNADGSGLRKLSPDDYPAATTELSPAWSPDGLRIAFTSDRGGGRSIYTIRPDGTDIRRITNEPTARDHEPSWSPDGMRLVFRRDRSVNNALDTDLVIAYVDGSDIVTLHKPGREHTPSWSPDGELIAYTSDAVGNDQRVFTMSFNGSNVVERAGGAAYGRYAAYPRWLKRQ